MEHYRKSHRCPTKPPILGRITLRKCKFKTAPKPIPSATPAVITPTINTPLLYPDPLTSSSNDTPKQTTHTLTLTLGRPKSLELYLDYYHITDQASKKDTQPILHVGGG